VKQWLYYGWLTFKTWVLFTYWKLFSKEDYDEQVKLYFLKRWEADAMKAYVKYLDTHGEEISKYEPEFWYVGTINPEKMMTADQRVNEGKNNA